MELNSSGLGLPVPFPDLKIVVIIPAKNEEQHIQPTLAALNQQVDSSGYPIDKNSYEIIVLANNCTDATAAKAIAFAKEHPACRIHIVIRNLAPENAHVGFARHMLMNEAYSRLMSLNRPRGVIASTDGDTIVSPTWIYHTLKAIDQGADVVGGRILTQAQPVGRLYYLLDVTYRYLLAQLESVINPSDVDPWPRHFQNFGPSLAVTCELYERSGRMPIIPFLEDVRFYEALQRCDARIRHCPHVQVLTSSRLKGRVSFGFSVQLQTWEQMHQQQIPFTVYNLNYWLFRFKLQKHLKCAWQRNSFSLIQIVTQPLQISPFEIYHRMGESKYFGTFWQWFIELPEIDSYVSRNFVQVSINKAIAELKEYIKHFDTIFPINPDDIAQYDARKDAEGIQYYG